MSEFVGLVRLDCVAYCRCVFSLFTVSGAEVMFVTIQRENILPSKKWINLLQCLNCPMFAVRLWITTSPYRWPIGSLPSTCMLCTPPHCTKDVCTPQGSTCDLWTVRLVLFSITYENVHRHICLGQDSNPRPHLWLGQLYASRALCR
jgi:hypothetical protein